MTTLLMTGTIDSLSESDLDAAQILYLVMQPYWAADAAQTDSEPAASQVERDESARYI